MSGAGEGTPAAPLLRDPVCGMGLDPRAAPATAKHGGRLHYLEALKNSIFQGFPAARDGRGAVHAHGSA